MMTIKEALNKLTPEQKKLLLYAFEHTITQVIELENRSFIGVWVKEDSTKYCILESNNNWSCGEIRE